MPTNPPTPEQNDRLDTLLATFTGILSELEAAIQAMILEAQIRTIEDLVIASGLYDINRAYSRNKFYPVDEPDVNDILADLKAQLEQLKGVQG
jgi:hypothetical protein